MLSLVVELEFFVFVFCAPKKRLNKKKEGSGGKFEEASIDIPEEGRRREVI